MYVTELRGGPFDRCVYYAEDDQTEIVFHAACGGLLGGYRKHRYEFALKGEDEAVFVYAENQDRARHGTSVPEHYSGPA